jgi:hypothetical protein
MQGKMISDLSPEQKAFKDILKRFDYQQEAIITFFEGFYNLTAKEIQAHSDPLAKHYHKIAKEMLPIEA